MQSIGVLNRQAAAETSRNTIIPAAHGVMPSVMTGLVTVPGVTTRTRHRSQGTTHPRTRSWRSMRSDPLPETGLENVVEVDADSTNLTLVDLELMQVRLRVDEALGTSPVVLPEIRAQPVL